jgi:hypothetical protein
MSRVDYEAILSQLHDVGRSLQRKNDELRRRCRELEAQYDAPPFGYYNRYVNQLLLKKAGVWSRKVQGLLGVARRLVGVGVGHGEIDGQAERRA